MPMLETPRCPEAFRRWYEDVDSGARHSGVCLRESGTECQVFEDFLAKCDAEADIVAHDQHLDEAESRLMEG